MAQEQYQGPTRKEAFNLIVMFLAAHQRALTLPFREGIGREAMAT